MSTSSIWPIDWTLWGALTPVQNGAGSNGNKGALHIPQSSWTGAPPSDCLVSYPQYSLGIGSYPSAEVQSAYSTAPSDWAETHMWSYRGLIMIYGISTLVGYSMPNRVYIYIYIYVCKEFGDSLTLNPVYRNINKIISTNSLLINFLKSQGSFVYSHKNCFKYSYLILLILFNIINYFAHWWMVSSSAA